MNDYKHIGKDFTPPDIVAKVTGKAKYAEDFRADGMVFARLYTSPMAHGRVVNIDTSALDGMEGVVGILTADDVPPVEAPNAPILTNTPTYIGEQACCMAKAPFLVGFVEAKRLKDGGGPGKKLPDMAGRP